MAYNNLQILNFNHNIVSLSNGNTLVITDNIKGNSINIPEPITHILQINSPGPQGPVGPSGSSGGTPGIDTVLSQNQALTANRSINISQSAFDINSPDMGSMLYITSSGYIRLGGGDYIVDFNTDGTGQMRLINGNQITAYAPIIKFGLDGTPLIVNISGSLDTSGSLTLNGNQTITGSNGRLVYTGTTPVYPYTLAEIHANDDYPWLERFYNDTFSTLSAVIAYYGDNNGNFFFHNESTQSISINVNGFNNNTGLSVYVDKVAFVNNVEVTGSLNVVAGITGSFTGSFSGDGSNIFNLPQTVGGNSGEIQYNNGTGGFAGNASMTFDGTTLTVTNINASGSFSGSFTENVLTTIIGNTSPGDPGFPVNLQITQAGTYIISSVYTGQTGYIYFPDPSLHIGQRITVQNRNGGNAADIDSTYYPIDISSSDITSIAAQTTKTFISAETDLGSGTFKWLEI